jgi:hypothetical protein
MSVILKIYFLEKRILVCTTVLSVSYKIHRPVLLYIILWAFCETSWMVELKNYGQPLVVIQSGHVTKYWPHVIVLNSENKILSSIMNTGNIGHSNIYLMRACQSQSRRGLRYGLSSPDQTLGSWVRIPLEAWMLVYVYFVFVLSCVGSGLGAGWYPAQGVLPTVYMIEKL